jgi:glycyl-tRNA synthetase beta chain
MEKNPHNKNLLVELFVEELPPKALNKLGEAFSSVLFENLKAQGLTLENAAVTAFASPRRLAAHISYIMDKAADKQVAQKLMPASVGLDGNGNATPALIKRLQGLGADESAVAKLRKENDGKADVLFFDAMQTGVTLPEGLQKALDEALAKLPIPKVMTYQLADGWSSVNFVRPAHSLVAMHGSSTIAINTLGLSSGNITYGHRFESKNEKIVLNHADSYEKQLFDEGSVIASFAARRKEIIKQLLANAKQNNCRIDCQPDLIGNDEETAYAIIEDDSLINEVTALVERPNILLGQFEESYLEVPAECLSLTMKTNQKYFPLYEDISGKKGKLTNKFLIVSNISPKDPSKVIGGNERVVRPRLADAKFFFDQDRKKTLESRIAGLDKVVYHNKLGSQGERVKHVQSIAHSIGGAIGGLSLAENAAKAALLAKADLLTDMVGEFPELQGIMGRYYAQNEKLDNDVAFAIEDHYKPRFSGDELPRNNVGTSVALADKLETLVGLFSIGEKPTGDKDPFALRRHALGLIRILIERDLPLEIDGLLLGTMQFFNIDTTQIDSIKTSISEFIYERLAGSLREQGFSTLEVDAVVSQYPKRLSDVPKRLDAVRNFSKLPEAPALAAANKRVGNILKKVEGEVKAEVNTNLLKEPTEIALNEALSKVKPQADKLFESGDYTASLQALAALKAPVDAFFDNVMVNADDPALKANRLGLLAILHQTMNRVADLSKLAS